MGKKAQLIKDSQKKAKKLRERIEEKRAEKELFLSNREISRLKNRISGATFLKEKIENN